jgi:pimeloyl-ACP methyl ester carboxylesterase
MELSSVDSGGRRFVFSDSGDGPPIVLFHGFPDTPSGWAPTAEVLAGAGYRAIVPFLRGYHPDTIVPGRGYGSREIGEDAILLLDALGLEQAVLVGHDWGAGVVYQAAAHAPERLRALCAVAIPHPRKISRSPALLWRARHFITLRLPTGPWLARRDDFRYLDVLMRRWAPRWSGPEREATLAAVKRCFSDPVVLDAALGYYRDARPGGEPGTLATPAMIVGGTTDIIEASAFTDSAELLGGPHEIVIAAGAGHWPHREAADVFHERLLAFLASLPESGPAQRGATTSA